MLTLQDTIEQIPLLKKAQDAALKVNLACERVISMGKFVGMLVPLKLQVYENGSITLPGDYETMVGASHKGKVQTIHDPWFEFAPRTNYAAAPDPDFYPADLGDNHVTYRSVEGAEALRLVPTDAGDVDSLVSISFRATEDQGIKASVSTIEDTISNLSEFGGGGLFSVTKFKKPRTLGWVSLEARFDGVWAEVARFAPRDTDIKLRKYSLPGASEGDTVIAYCKKRFRPVEDLSDELPINSIYCVRMAMEALLAEVTGDLEKVSGL
jgi:hypothetical protein